MLLKMSVIGDDNFYLGLYGEAQKGDWGNKMVVWIASLFMKEQSLLRESTLVYVGGSPIEDMDWLSSQSEIPKLLYILGGLTGIKEWL